MRLWHQKLIPYLDKKRLFGQHRECCALRGKGWGKKHSVVDYVFKYRLDRLYAYHCLVMNEMVRQFNANIDVNWYNRLYRGKSLPKATLDDVGIYVYGYLLSHSRCAGNDSRIVRAGQSQSTREHQCRHRSTRDKSNLCAGRSHRQFPNRCRSRPLSCHPQPQARRV